MKFFSRLFICGICKKKKGKKTSNVEIQTKYKRDIMVIEENIECRPEREKQMSLKDEILKKKDVKKSYRNLVHISNGKFSKVFRGKDIFNNYVALKRVHKSFSCSVRKECEMLISLKSDHIIKLLDIIQKDDFYYIVLPYYEIDLFDALPKVIGKPRTVIKIIHGIAKGIYDIHKKGYIHGDIKLENIVLNSCYKPIIIDLGLTKKITNDKSFYQSKLSGTLTYLPPEVVDQQLYTEGMDVWSLGIVMYILMFGTDPLNVFADKQSEIFNNIKYREAFYPVRWEINNKIIYNQDHIYFKLVRLNKHMLNKRFMDRIPIKNVIIYLEEIKSEMDKEISRRSIKLNHDKQIEHLKRWKTF